MIRVQTDSATGEVLLLSETGYSARLAWPTAALLGTLLLDASKQAEPDLPGRRYEPKQGRWG